MADRLWLRITSIQWTLVCSVVCALVATLWAILVTFGGKSTIAAVYDFIQCPLTIKAVPATFTVVGPLLALTAFHLVRHRSETSSIRMLAVFSVISALFFALFLLAIAFVFHVTYTPDEAYVGPLVRLAFSSVFIVAAEWSARWILARFHRYFSHAYLNDIIEDVNKAIT